MISKKNRLTIVRFVTAVGFIVVLFGPGVVYTGNAEPYLSPPSFIGGQIDVLFLMFGGFALLYLFNPHKLLRYRYWKAGAKANGLSPTSGGFLRPPVYTGTIRGRAVRARIGRNRALSTQTRRRYTVVEAALSGEPTSGAVISPHDHDGVAAYNVAEFPTAEANDLVAVGSDDGLARDVLDSSVTSALRSVDSFNQVYAGDAKAAGDTLPDDERVPYSTYPGLTSEIDAAHDDSRGDRNWLGGKGWVSHVSWGTVLDSTELGRHIEAVVTVAESFDQSTARVEHFET